MDELPVLHFRLLVHKENDGEGQLVLIGTKRADVVAKALRQHRYRAVHKIDARGTLVGFLIYNRAFLDVMADVGYVDTHLI